MGCKTKIVRPFTSTENNLKPQYFHITHFVKTKQAGPKGWSKNMYPPAPEVNIEVGEPNRSFMMNEFQTFELGVRGCCSNFAPPEGYWCSDKTSGGGAFTYRIPSGITVDQGTLPNGPYKNATDGVVQAFRPGHWASWMFEVDSSAVNGSAQTLSWTKGGFQGARGSDKGAEWFVENFREELDFPNEFFYDKTAKKLYYVANSTAGPTGSRFEAAVLQDLINVAGLPPTRGTHRTPVIGFKLLGVGVRDAALTYFEPHSMPSGGDWGLQRMAAVFFENTVGSTVEDCIFERNDGIAVMFSGYNREAVVRGSEFVWNGETAIAGWGYTDNMDGTSGEQPRGTLIEGKATLSCCLLFPRTTPFPEEKSIPGVIYGVLLWADMNAATPLGARGCCVISLGRQLLP